MNEREFWEIVYRALMMLIHALRKRFGFGGSKDP